MLPVYVGDLCALVNALACTGDITAVPGPLTLHCTQTQKGRR